VRTRENQNKRKASKKMKVTKMLVGELVCTAALVLAASQVSAQVINGGFETAGPTTTGAQGWNDFSSVAPNYTASASRSLVDPFAGVAELTLTYNVLTVGTGPSVIAQSDIFGGISAGPITLSYEAKRVASAGFENNQVQVQWFDAGNGFLGATGFQSYNGTLTPAYSLQTINYVAPALTAKALVQFLTAGSANLQDTATIRIDNVALVPVPEPATFALLGLGSLALMVARRRK
jgi:hypothetical protein